MAHQQLPQPSLLNVSRRFGRYEPFQRFDHLSSSQASLGSKNIGRMTVDCKFLFKKSKWGVLGESRFPAGIIYLDLNFGSPAGCRLKSATVKITLDDGHDCIRHYNEAPLRSHHKSHCPVQMTDWYGPKQLTGEIRSINGKRSISMIPELSSTGVGVGGVGASWEKEFSCTSRWALNGQLLPGKDTWSYKTLRWDLSENELESQCFHSNLLHTAFAFEHAGQPFLMTVQIEGKLERWHDRVKSRLKFGSKHSNSDGQVGTLIDFGSCDSFQDRLDVLAKSLSKAMEVENYQQIPVEMPNYQSASLQSTLAPTFCQATNISIHKEGPLSPPQTPSILSKSTLVPPPKPEQSVLPSTAGELRCLLEDRDALQSRDTTRPSTEMLKALISMLSNSQESYKTVTDGPQRSSSSSVPLSSPSTMLATEERHEHTSVSSDCSEDTVRAGKMVIDEKAVAEVLQIPLLLAFVQLITWLKTILKPKPKPLMSRPPIELSP